MIDLLKSNRINLIRYKVQNCTTLVFYKHLQLKGLVFDIVLVWMKLL